MGIFERIGTDPASVGHEGDWGLWEWLGAVGLVLLAIALVILGCCAAIWTARGAGSFDDADWGDGWWGNWGPLITVFVLAVVTVVSCVAGPMLLAVRVHGIARHTASIGLSFALIIGVYVLAYVAVWKAVEWVATGFGADDFHDVEERIWRWILRGAAVVFAGLAVLNIAIEGLNLISAGLGVAISMFLAVVVMGVMFAVASGKSR